MKIYRVLITSVIVFFSSFALAAPGVDSSGGTDTFIEAVKKLSDKGQEYRALSEHLQSLGLQSVDSKQKVEFFDSGVEGISKFLITEVYESTNGEEGPKYLVTVEGLIRNDPPSPNESDVFMVESYDIQRIN